MKIDLNTSDPLTLGLTLGIGHPVKQRIRRLTMRQTNKYMVGGTVMIIAAGLGLSSTALSLEAGAPVKEAVATVLDKVEAPALPKFEAAPEAPPSAAPTAPTITPKKLAEAPSTPPAVQSAGVAGLPPMRLRFHARFTTEQLEKIESRRQAYAGSEKDKIAKAALHDTFLRAVYKNRFELTIDDIGVGHMQISLGQGGWPGYPVQNTKWLKRDLTPKMQSGLKHIIEKCSFESGPVFFNADVTEGDADIGMGTYEVECAPGSENNYKNLSDRELAFAYLNSSELPLQDRQGGFQWRIRHAMMYEYVNNNPGATLADDQAACIRINTTQKNKHAFTDMHRRSADHFLEKCHGKDYNGIRKRFDLPDAQ